MAKKRKSAGEGQHRPAPTPEAREQQLVSLAVDLAEKQLRDGTASNQVIIHYLKLGTKREQLELEQLQRRTELVTAQAESVKSAQRVEELYSEALEAMRVYSGSNKDDEELYEDEY